MLAAILLGCTSVAEKIQLPSQSKISRDQLEFYSDFRLPSKHRLLEELTSLRGEICKRLWLPVSDEPIRVFVFQDAEQFATYLTREHSDFLGRRALFVKDDTTLNVLAYWGDDIAVDLRHEITHGYLHSVVPGLPLWLDEGLAEYFEVRGGQQGFHAEHIYLLSEAFRRHEWSPDLKKLETLDQANQLEQIHYAESWLWVHFLLSDENSSKLLSDQLARLRMIRQPEPLSQFVNRHFTDADQDVITHLKNLTEGL
jgi:hypothetical protein